MRNLMPLTYAVATMVVIDAVWNPTVLTLAALFPGWATTTLAPIAGPVDAASLIFKYVTMIVFATWIYQAGRNLILAGYEDLEFSSASRIWWFFIPIASLFKPFQGMRELWNASHAENYYGESNSLVSAWWAAYLLNEFIGVFLRLTSIGSDAASVGTTPIWVDSAVGAVLAVLAILMITRIARAQRQLGGPALTEVFA